MQRSLGLLSTALLLAGCAGPATPREKRAAPVATVAAPATSAAPAVAAAPKRTREITLDVEDAPVEDVVRAIQRLTGAPIRLVGEAKDRVTFSVRKAPWRDVLAYVAQAGRLSMREGKRDEVVLIARPKNAFVASGAPVTTWLRLLAQQSGKSIIMPGHLDGEITCELHDVAPEDALAASADMVGLVVIDDDGQLLVDRAASGR